MKQYLIRNEKEEILFNKTKEIYEEYLAKKCFITDLATKNIVYLAKNIPQDIIIDWVIDDIIDTWIWKITESPGPRKDTKYSGQRYWTTEAIECYLTNLEEGKRGKELYQRLRHEHVYEKKKIINEIIKNPTDSRHVISSLEIVIACVIEKEEHSKLVKEAVGWKRYLGEKIRVIDLLKDKELEQEDLRLKE